MSNLQKFKDNLAKSIYNMTAKEAIAKGICIDCKKPAVPRCHTALGAKEYEISGLCEECWDRTVA